MPRTILIVDESETNRQGLKSALCGKYDILEAENVETAVRLPTLGKVDHVVMPYRPDALPQGFAEVETRRREEILRLIVLHSERVIYRYDLKTRRAESVEPAASRAMILPEVVEDMPEDLIKQGVIVAEDVEYVRQLFARAQTDELKESVRFRARSRDGGVRWLDVKYTFIREGGVPVTAIISCADVTALHEREVVFARYRQTVEDSRTAESLYFETDLTADCVLRREGDLTPLATDAVGLPHDEVVKRIVNAVTVGEDLARVRRHLSRANLIKMYKDGQKDLSLEWRVILTDEKMHWVHVALQMVADPYTAHIILFLIVTDITGEKSLMLETQKRAETDGMTGLLNKTTAVDIIRERLSRPGGAPCALLVADLDSLKSINDGHGHDMGDRAIVSFAEALRAQFRKSDIVGRIGGDEFIAFLEGVGSEEVLRDMLSAFMRRLSQTRLREENDVPLRGSIGAALGRIGEVNYETMFKQADRALYHVKRNGKDNFALYTPDMEDDDYRYPSGKRTIWRTSAIDRNEIRRLMGAVAVVYPLIISVNLTQDNYHILQCDNYWSLHCLDSGRCEDLFSASLESCHPASRKAFLRAFTRESLTAARARGDNVVTFDGRQMTDSGSYRVIRADAVFVRGDREEDIVCVVMAREIDRAEK